MAANASPEVVGQVVSLPIADIEIGDRLRPIDPVYACALGAVIKREGQEDPIKVCRLPGRSDWRLVTGGHRLVGMDEAGLTHINAIVVDAEAVSRLMREISENLWRKGLSPIDRATFVAELVRLKKLQAGLGLEESGRSISAKVRWAEEIKSDARDANANIALAYGWADGVADQIGLSRRSIYNDLELHRRLLPDVVAALRGHPASGNAAQLRALAKYSEADQRSAVAMLVEGAAKSPSEALKMLRQTHHVVLDPDEAAHSKRWSAFFSAFQAMSAYERGLALRELSTRKLPAGFAITFDNEVAR